MNIKRVCIKLIGGLISFSSALFVKDLKKNNTKARNRKNKTFPIIS